jgi:hypothetical protein
MMTARAEPSFGIIILRFLGVTEVTDGEEAGKGM